jgi:hypothetical protein
MDIVNGLAQALLETILFLEFADEDIIHLDSAVSQMELIGSILQDMEQNAKEEFLNISYSMAKNYHTFPAKAAFLSSVGEYLGLV